jgi:hypothetical protein
MCARARQERNDTSNNATEKNKVLCGGVFSENALKAQGSGGRKGGGGLFVDEKRPGTARINRSDNNNKNTREENVRMRDDIAPQICR